MRSDHVQWVRDNPDLQLLKARLKLLLVLLKKRPMLRQVRDIHKKPRQIVFVKGALMLPSPAQGLRQVCVSQDAAPNSDATQQTFATAEAPARGARHSETAAPESRSDASRS